MEIDPVCGMTVEKTTAAAKVTYLEKTYYFCSEGCHKAFTAEPGKYARSGNSANEPRKEKR